MKRRQLLVFDPRPRGQELDNLLRARGWKAQFATNVAEATSACQTQSHLLGLAVVHEPDVPTIEALEQLTAGCPIDWVVLLPPGLLLDEAWARLVVKHFYDHLTRPLDIDRLSVILGHAYGRAELTRGLEKDDVSVGRYQMVGKSLPMLELYAQLDRVTQVDAPVLIQGESGTGKELVAQAIHRHSPRAQGPFVPVNCGGLPDTLIHSELFGHEKGAFTGAHQRRIGSLEAAQHGVVFLDEIGDLPLALQANLLRFLQERTIVRLGSAQRIPIDVRVVAATHVDLQKAVHEGRFREDLYYRLNVLRLEVPPLRERGRDIELLVDQVFRDNVTQKSRRVQGVSREAVQSLYEYTWPGNVRELINRVQRAMIMSRERFISPADLGLPPPRGGQNVVPLPRARAAFERQVIQSALSRNGNNMAKTARDLGVSRVTLYRLLGRFDIARQSIDLMPRNAEAANAAAVDAEEEAIKEQGDRNVGI